MITRKEREGLHPWDFPANTLGCDCDGKTIMSGDTVEVVEEDRFRKGHPDYLYCSAGKQGRVMGKEGLKSIAAIDWTIIVEFPTDNGPKTVGCTDIHLRKL